MDKRIKPFKYAGRLNAMCSKSYLQRALAIASLARGQSRLINIQWSDDGLAALDSIKQLGAQVTGDVQGGDIYVQSVEEYPNKPLALNVGESGLSLRMFSAIAGLGVHNTEINGIGSLRNRPLAPIVDTLSKAGITINNNEDKLPINIIGPYPGGRIEIDGSFSSQILSGLLIALPLINSDSTIIVHNLKSKPYVDMTLSIIHDFGVDIENIDYKIFQIQGGQHYKSKLYAVEGDWSAAANHLVGAAISGSIKMQGLSPSSAQADRAVLEVIRLFGANVNVDNDYIQVTKKELLPFQFDATECPDIFPPLVILASAAQGMSKIKGTHRLINKESNRLVALTHILDKMGVNVELEDDTICINGKGYVNGGEFSSFHDHRIAMAAAIAGTISLDDLWIKDADSINKSYPNFFEDLCKVSV